MQRRFTTERCTLKRRLIDGETGSGVPGRFAIAAGSPSTPEDWTVQHGTVVDGHAALGVSVRGPRCSRAEDGPVGLYWLKLEKHNSEVPPRMAETAAFGGGSMTKSPKLGSVWTVQTDDFSANELGKKAHKRAKPIPKGAQLVVLKHDEFQPYPGDESHAGDEPPARVHFAIAEKRYWIFERSFRSSCKLSE